MPFTKNDKNINRSGRKNGSTKQDHSRNKNEVP